jgi:Ser-tRNA(Ala) deacylase AlaX
MSLLRTVCASVILTATAFLPVQAGAPDNPGERGAIVNNDRTLIQERDGKNGWGKVVSGVARGENPKEDRKLGEYLRDNAEGPNPDNDNGAGND